jgi:predicted adenine nucleotide alpha hydrolase (AANH) superfamily ATPase
MMNNVFLHICCAPCSVYPVQTLKTENVSIIGFFFNPNIQPSREYMKRRESLQAFSAAEELEMIWAPYEMEFFFDNVKHSKERCRLCYELRLERTAREAVKYGCGSYSTTLLYSKRQNHELIKEIGYAVGEKYGVNFFYKDFRNGWEEGVEKSKKLGLYRQNYCGCVFSEKERFFR